MEKFDIAGLKIDSVSKADLLNIMDQRIKQQQKTFLTTPYSEFLYRGFLNPEIFEMLNKANIAVPDGIGIFWAKKFLDLPLTANNYWFKILQALWQAKWTLAAVLLNPKWIKSAFKEKISGSDFIWDLAKFAADNNFSIYLLGGFGDTPKIASEKLKIYCSRTYNLQLTTYYSNKNPEDQTIINDIKNAAPDLLLVAYGPVVQEKWIAENLHKLPVKLALGLGGSFDYIAQKQPSPPHFLRSIGLEWLFRLTTQPKRFIRIYHATIGLIMMLIHYKVFTSFSFRRNTAVVILNYQNLVLICQRDPKNHDVDIIYNQESLSNENYWQFPQGGIDEKEEIVQAAAREAYEETGLKNLQLISISKNTNTYYWNNALRKFWKNRFHQNPGQIQNIVYFKYHGNNNDVKIDNHEFINFRWINVDDLENSLHPERLPLTKIARQDLNDMLKDGKI